MRAIRWRGNEIQNVKRLKEHAAMTTPLRKFFVVRIVQPYRMRFRPVRRGASVAADYSSTDGTKSRASSFILFEVRPDDANPTNKTVPELIYRPRFSHPDRGQQRSRVPLLGQGQGPLVGALAVPATYSINTNLLQPQTFSFTPKAMPRNVIATRFTGSSLGDPLKQQAGFSRLMRRLAPRQMQWLESALQIPTHRCGFPSCTFPSVSYSWYRSRS